MRRPEEVPHCNLVYQLQGVYSQFKTYICCRKQRLYIHSIVVELKPMTMHFDQGNVVTVVHAGTNMDDHGEQVEPLACILLRTGLPRVHARPSKLLFFTNVPFRNRNATDIHKLELEWEHNSVG